jgi:tetratricopeptide (TPR) repeat protein
MLIGLGLTLYTRGQYDEAIKTLSQAADLEPSDPRPYLFLAKMYNVSTVEAPGVTERLRRFVELEPRNAQALYYYALSLWKGAREQKREADLTEIERLLKNAAGLDPRFADAHLQLGILWAYRKDYPEAIREYQQAIRLEPSLVDAHYRLAQAYVRTGEKERAQGEFDTYARLHNQQQAEKEKQRAEIQQFVYTLQENNTP